MNDFLYKKEHAPTTIDWANLVFFAEAHEEPFQEVSVITLKSHYNDLCHEQAVVQVHHFNDRTIHSRAIIIMNSGTVSVQEFVNVNEDRSVVIAIDADTITDHEVDVALGYLAEAEIPGITYFGEGRTYDSEAIKGAFDATIRE